MKTKDIFSEIYSALLSNKVRTGLTMLGIIIGIGSVIVMVAIGQGVQGTIETNIQSLGSNLVQVMPGTSGNQGFGVSQGRGSAKTLLQTDADAIKAQVSSVQDISPELSGRYQITAKGTNTNTSVVGVTPSYPSVRNLTIDTGNFVSDANEKGLGRVAVLGPTARDDLFGVDVDVVGQTIRINGMQFSIIGVSKTKGGSGFQNQDDMIFIPLSSAQKFLAGSDYLSNISVQVVDQQSMTNVQNDITTLLLERHKISDIASADFTVLNQNDIVSTAATITNTFTILLGAVAGISLLVGGIGIMNMMLTTVTERTREIGLRKAIGAKSKDVNKQFLFEAIALTLIGGIIGMMIGIGISLGLSTFGILQTKISIGSIVLAFCVSALIGIIFGYYPAKRASKLNPIDALRYE